MNRASKVYGDMGNTGMTGATGFSAYDVAVGNGFEGSITQWLASIKVQTVPMGSLKK